MSKLKKYEFYTLTGQDITILNQPMTQRHIDKITQTYYHHIIPKLDERFVLESIIFCLSSAKTNYEQPVKFIKSLKDIPTKELYNSELIYYRAKHGTTRIQKVDKNIFESAINYTNNDAVGFAKEFLNNPYELREELVKNVKFIAHKTASFIYLTLGGDVPILTTDIHVSRQAALLGIQINEKHTLGVKRKTGKTIPETLTNKKYLDVEKQILDLFASTSFPQKYPYFLNSKGELHGGLLTTFLWTPGTELARKKDPAQLSFFEQEKFVSPYSN